MLSRNTITVRAIAPISSPSLVAGMRAEVSPELEAICLACLQKEPELRPTAEQLAQGLERFLDGEPAPMPAKPMMEKAM